MKNRKLQVLLLFGIILLLTACGKTPEESAKETIKLARETFEYKPKATNEEIEGLQVYIPPKFKISNESDQQNIILTKGKQPFILFINPNEASNSKLFYELLHASDNLTILEEEQFTAENDYGFAAVIDYEDEMVELVVNAGGAKISTVTKSTNMHKDVQAMMEIVRSIQL